MLTKQLKKKYSAVQTAGMQRLICSIVVSTKQDKICLFHIRDRRFDGLRLTGGFVLCPCCVLEQDIISSA